LIKNLKGKKIDIQGVQDGIPCAKLVYLIEMWATQNNLIVIEILVNNIPVDRADEAALAKKIYSASDDVLIKTQEPREAALAAVREAKKQIPAFEKIIDEIITAQQKGEKEESIAKFSRLLKSLSDVIHLFKVLERYKPAEFEGIRVNDKSITQVNEEMLEILQETKLAMEDQDFVTINDLLEYEIKPKISTDFLSILEELEKIIPRS
jgi:hypothetical protein